MGITSNATMLYGHIETVEERVAHLLALQPDVLIVTGDAPLALVVRQAVQTASVKINPHVSSMRLAAARFCAQAKSWGGTSALSRADRRRRLWSNPRGFLDNFPHLKSYWPMIGKPLAQLSLSFGVDDMDGTINDTTRIYSLAGASEQNPRMTVSEMKTLILEGD